MNLLSPEAESASVDQVRAPLGRRAISVVVGSLLLFAASCGGDKPSSGATDTLVGATSSSSDSDTIPSNTTIEPTVPIGTVPLPTVPVGESVPTTSPEAGSPISVEMQEFRLKEIFSRPESIDQLQALSLSAIVTDGAGNFSVVDGIGGVRYDTSQWDDGTVLADWQDPSEDLDMALIVQVAGNTYAVTDGSVLLDPSSTEPGVVDIFIPRVDSISISSEGPPSFSDLGTFSNLPDARDQVLFVPDMWGDKIAPSSFDALLAPKD